MHKAFFGDRERDFSLTPHLIPELERITGKGIAAIVGGVRRASFAELVNTIRLGLIGGGVHPEEATSLINAYVKAHPLGEVHLLALDILNDLWTGPTDQPVNDTAASGDLAATLNGGAV
ncbi:gene transfer agent family protein [Devosia naphthalenivorans]|uniref:gene transfer agent family protein n=1 Tax=Devosia naphthalenivorans TaxID=2082392 RepID=UPI000D3CD253|nr:gene transfer agent family protein [Devosia naphthalenivorans]